MLCIFKNVSSERSSVYVSYFRHDPRDVRRAARPSGRSAGQRRAKLSSCCVRQTSKTSELCVFPELCLCGYTCADLLIHPPLLSGCLQALDTLLHAPVRAAFVVGLPLEIGGRLYNCAVAVCGGRILGVVPKTHLPNSGEFYEKRWFEPGHSAPESMTLCGQTVPVGGDLVFDCGPFSFGVELCEDLWVPAPPSGQALHGRRADDRQSLRLQRTGHQASLSLRTDRPAERAMPVRLPLCGRGLWRIDHRSRVLRLCGRL